MPNPLQVPGAKRTLFLALTMSFIGFVGVTTSITNLLPAHGEAVHSDPSLPPEVQQAVQTVIETFDRAPIHQGVSVANLLASALLLVASFALTGRTRTAMWWVTQALVANALYALAAGAGNAYLVHVHRDTLLALFRAVAVAQSTPLDGIEAIPPFLMLSTIAFYTFFAGIYLLLLRAARREDVRRFVAREV